MLRVSATDLVRRLSDILGRVRYRGDVYLIERHNVAIAQLGPPPGGHPVTLREAMTAWQNAAPATPEFADDLERVNSADQPPTSAWDS